MDDIDERAADSDDSKDLSVWQKLYKELYKLFRRYKRKAYKFYQTKLKSLVETILLIVGLGFLYEMIYNRQVFSSCMKWCKKDSQR